MGHQQRFVGRITVPVVQVTLTAQIAGTLLGGKLHGSCGKDAISSPPSTLYVGTGYARYSLLSAGQAQWSNGKDDTSEDGTINDTLGMYAGEWLNSGANSDYQVSCTLTGNAVAAGSSATDGSWLVLSTTRYWEINVLASSSTKDTTLTLSIRRVSDSVTIAGPITVALAVN